jgi:cytochrome b561
MRAAGRYTRTAIAFHWATAGAACFMLCLGYAMVLVPRHTAWRGPLFDLHKAIGLMILALMVSRLAWRLGHRTPPLLGLPSWMARSAKANHWLLYVLLICQPVTGYIGSAFGAYGVAVLGVRLAPRIGPDPGVRALLIFMHHAIAIALVLLILLHVAAAIRHARTGRADIVRRMSWREGVADSG